MNGNEQRLASSKTENTLRNEASSNVDILIGQSSDLFCGREGGQNRPLPMFTRKGKYNDVL